MVTIFMHAHGRVDDVLQVDLQEPVPACVFARRDGQLHDRERIGLTDAHWASHWPAESDSAGRHDAPVRERNDPRVYVRSTCPGKRAGALRKSDSYLLCTGRLRGLFLFLQAAFVYILL